MNIPPVNHLATDECREITKRIVEKMGHKIFNNGGTDSWIQLIDGNIESHIHLPKGSLTLCQAVEMLAERGVEWLPSWIHLNGSEKAGWYKKTDGRPRYYMPIVYCDPHSLPDALRALEKAVE